MKKEICPSFGEKVFLFIKPLKSEGKAYSYLYGGHYDAEKYRRSGGSKFHIRWCCVGKSDRKKEVLRSG